MCTASRFARQSLNQSESEESKCKQRGLEEEEIPLFMIKAEPADPSEAGS